MYVTLSTHFSEPQRYPSETFTTTTVHHWLLPPCCGNTVSQQFAVVNLTYYQICFIFTMCYRSNQWAHALANCSVWNYAPVEMHYLRLALEWPQVHTVTHSLFTLSIPPIWRRGFMFSTSRIYRNGYASSKYFLVNVDGRNICHRQLSVTSVLLAVQLLYASGVICIQCTKEKDTVRQKHKSLTSVTCNRKNIHKPFDSITQLQSITKHSKKPKQRKTLNGQQSPVLSTCSRKKADHQVLLALSIPPRWRRGPTLSCHWMTNPLLCTALNDNLNTPFPARF